MTIKIIHNPYSARWISLERKPEMIAALTDAGLSFEIDTTEGPGHAIELTAQAVRDGYSTILAAGGDGTLGEVVNGLILGADDQPLPKFGIMPLGTANDLVFNLGLPDTLPEMAEVIAKNFTKNIDVCRVNDRYFLNNAGIGLEPYITVQHEKIKRLKGITRYLVATIIGISHNPKWEMHIQWDDGEYTGPVSLVSIGNGARTGGFFMAPSADPFDGKLHFTFGFVPRRLQKFGVLPKAFRAGEGNLTEDPRVHEKSTTWLKISTTPSPAHSDGELFDLAITKLEYRIFPAMLPILVDPDAHS
jgi:diacylglycerol kinase (ATP)